MSDPRSVAEVLTDVICNIQDILSSEIRLAKAEARQELRAMYPAGALIVIGALGGLLSVLFLLLAFVAALSLVIEVWEAALLVAVGMAIVCAVMLRVGGNRLKNSQATATTRATAKEKVKWSGQPIK